MTVQAIIAAQQQADLARLHNNNRVLDSIHRESLSTDINSLKRRVRELEKIIKTQEEEIEIGRIDLNNHKEAIVDYQSSIEKYQKASLDYQEAISRWEAAYNKKVQDLSKAHLVAGQWSQVAQVLRESIKILLDEARTCPAQAHHVFGKGKSEETLWQEMHDEGIRRHNEEVASKAQPT